MLWNICGKIWDIHSHWLKRPNRRLARLIGLVPPRSAGLSTLTATLSTEFKVAQAGNNLTGQSYNQVGTTVDLRKNYNIGTTAANNAAGGADEVFSFQQAIVAAGSATIDLTAMTNLVQQASVNIVRIKGYQIRLLSGTDDTTINPTPNANSQMVVTNNGPTLPANLDFGLGGSGLTLTIGVAGGVINSVSIGAAGSGYPPSSTFIVAPVQSGGSGGVIYVTTNASGVPTTVGICAGGAGYSAATVPSTPLGAYTLTTGGAHMNIDVTASGVTVDSTHKNVKLFNLDASNGITAEIDVIGATS